MTEIKVVDWVDAEAIGNGEVAIGGLGGIQACMFWEEYIEGCDQQVRLYYEALREAILERGAITGEYHQGGEDGTPLFSDGKIASFSFRGWGDFLSAVYNTEIEERKWNYMDFYYIYLPEDERIKVYAK